MQIKNKYNNKKFLKYYFVLLIFQIHIYLLRCEICPNCNVINNKCLENGSSEPSDIYHLHKENGKCYKCPESTEFYIINDDTCIQKTQCENKIIDGTNECVGQCPSNTYELGDYCYDECKEDKNIYEKIKMKMEIRKIDRIIK